MKFGSYEVSFVNHGSFRLDGGSMFGAVPKTLWARLMAPDEDNCIRLIAGSLLIRSPMNTILVDVGNGNKWSEKLAKIFGITNTPSDQLPFKREEITDIILTHLHFDHAAGISYVDENQQLALSYPNARVFLQEANLENGKNPNPRERASYLPNHVNILESANLELLDGSKEVFPGIWVHQMNGHTVGQQYVELKDGNRSILFPSDLCPTSHHLPVPYNMGYDICARTLLQEKETFLSDALEREAIVVFQHDPELHAAKITRNNRGHFAVGSPVDFS